MAKCMLRISNIRGEYSQLQLYDSRSGFRPDACQNGKFSVVGLVLWLLPSFCLLLGFPFAQTKRSLVLSFLSIAKSSKA